MTARMLSLACRIAGGRGGVALRTAVLFTLVASLVAIPRFSASAHTTHTTYPKPPWIIGLSNSLYGNGWREEMVCSVKAEAAATPYARLVSKVLVTQAGQDPARQISDIRGLISQGANAILINPPNPTALNGVIEQAVRRGIVVVVMDQLVTSRAPYQVENNQVEYGTVGMAWLARQLHGKGNAVIVRGIAGAPADTDRENGIRIALKKYPGIHVIGEIYSEWNPVTALQRISTFLPAHPKIDGWWTSGVGGQVVQAYQQAKRKFVPVVGADGNDFLAYLYDLRRQGLIGAAVTNPPAVGSAAFDIALKVLQGQTVPKITKLMPRVWDNTEVANLKGKFFRKLGPSFQAAWNVPGYSHYAFSQMTGCFGKA